MTMIPYNNETVPMTRRYPNLPKKILNRDAKIGKKLVHAWDVEHDSAKVLQIFLKYKDLLSNERYWELLRTVWIMCGKLKNTELFRKLLSSKRPMRYYFSTPEEIETVEKMPDKITVCRATNDENDGGIAYTNSCEYAQWYQEEFEKNMIVTREIDKSDIFAFIGRNKENEILIL